MRFGLWPGSWRAWGRGLISASLLAAAGCGGSETPLGAPDSYLLYAPSAGSPPPGPGGLPVVDRLDADEGTGLLLTRMFSNGFAAEMVRSVHLAKQLVRNGTLAGRRYDERLRAQASEPLCLVVGLPEPGARPLGLAVARWLRAPVERVNTAWLGLPGNLGEDQAAVQTVTGRLAAHAAAWISGGRASPPGSPGVPASTTGSIAEAYRMAMEVIAREWRVGRGSAGVVPGTAGTEAQRQLFAEIRENRAALGADGKTLRPAAELLSDPQIAATVIYRLAQNRGVAQAVASAETYTPFVSGPLPEGISGAAVLGSIRNFQAKLFSAWGRAVLAGRPPGDIVELLEAYLDMFPAERKEVWRVFLVTTYLGTVKPGGMSRDPEQGDQMLAEVAAVTEDLLAGKRTLRDALARR
jgi:hypothetical protein